MAVLDDFRKIAQVPFNEYLHAHRDNGGKIIGIFCSYMPEEMVMAAGMVPFRMRAVGSTKTTLGDTWFSSFNCSYVRHVMDLALEGEFRFLDGLVFVNACDHIRRMFDNWRAAVDHPPFIHMTAVPRKRAGGALSWYQEELRILKEAMEAHFEIAISDDALRGAIRTTNRIRGLLERLYELRKRDSPPISGAETLAAIMAGTALPRERFATMLEELLEELSGRKVYAAGAPRLMLQSGCLEEIDHIELIEEQGGAVVDDSLCFGRRYFDTAVDEDVGDPLQALAERYMNHLSCPRMSDDWGRRIDRLGASVKDFRIDGLICEKLKFCDLWGGEAFIMRRDSKKTGLPTLYLERELHGGGEGQLKTRVQAFLERIGRT